ncbi:MAG: AI-2E family transporter [Oscillospiraceae bacterium]|nr:AI-2E family transporter [Oscillospiraceae bacterium]
MNRFNKKTYNSLLPWFFLALAVLIAHRALSDLTYFTGLLRQIWTIITPFFYGFLLAYILNIPRGGLERLLGRTNVPFIVKRKHGFSVILVYLLLLLFLYLILNLVLPTLFSSIALFITNFPNHYENVLQFIRNLNTMDLFGIYIDTDEISAAVQTWLQGFQLGDIMSQINTIIGVSGAVFGGLFRGFLATVSSVYILIEKDRFQAFFFRLLRAFTSAKVCKGITKRAEDLNQNFKQYIRTQTIDGLILGTVVTIQLMIMGSPYALVLGIMLGVVNYIPYFGSIIGSLIAIVVVAFTQGLTMGAIAAVVLLITQQIDGNFIQPKLMGGSFSLSPLLVIISITVGGAVAGILGMIAAIPIVAVLKDILESIIKYYEAKRAEASASTEQ